MQVYDFHIIYDPLKYYYVATYTCCEYPDNSIDSSKWPVNFIKIYKERLCLSIHDSNVEKSLVQYTIILMIIKL